MESLQGKVAVVTGGGNGIGRGLVLAMADAGADVVVADIDEGAAKVVADEASERGVRTLAVGTDVADAASVEALAETAFSQLGAVHVVCNNAGVLLMAQIRDLIVEDWRWLFSINVMGVVHGVHAFLPRLLEQGQPAHIVNTASVAALGSGGVYGASKAAVLSISESLHAELASVGVGVSVLCPANISSRINSSQRNRPPEFGRKVDEPFAEIVDFGLDPLHVGRRAVKAVLEDELYVFVFPEGWEQHLKPGAEARFEAILRAVDSGGVPEGST
jgi:NAD(P)-dependent dehydrogenase (short-subunit alcohol dehydrogenase family)